MLVGLRSSENSVLEGIEHSRDSKRCVQSITKTRNKTHTQKYSVPESMVHAYV